MDLMELSSLIEMSYHRVQGYTFIIAEINFWVSKLHQSTIRHLYAQEERDPKSLMSDLFPTSRGLFLQNRLQIFTEKQNIPDIAQCLFS
jgi:hypothetical protein